VGGWPTLAHYAFGGENVKVATCPQAYKFTGYERDPETGLDYSIFRYYNSRVGRFMSPDPIEGAIGDPQSLNRYSYVGNDPVNFIDPLGLSGYFWAGSCLYHSYDYYVDGRYDSSETFFVGCYSSGGGGGGGGGVGGAAGAAIAAAA